MLIIIHRVNTIEELKTVPKEYGVEIDIRAYGNKLILNHEPHEEGDDLREYLKHYNHALIIFNIKEDGIEDEIIELAKEHNISNYFLLDVEYPFIYRATRKMNFKKIAIRYSEAEPIEFALAHKNMADWVWVDTNTVLPLNNESYNKLKQVGYRLCLVCPERWGRPEDIQKYKDQLNKDGIKLDAVMTALSHVKSWLS